MRRGGELDLPREQRVRTLFGSAFAPDRAGPVTALFVTFSLKRAHVGNPKWPTCGRVVLCVLCAL